MCGLRSRFREIRNKDEFRLKVARRRLDAVKFFRDENGTAILFELHSAVQPWRKRTIIQLQTSERKSTRAADQIN